MPRRFGSHNAVARHRRRHYEEIRTVLAISDQTMAKADGLRMRVTAEAAPLDVLLEPVPDREAASDYTLRAVSVVRSVAGQYVVWEYLNGRTRTFSVGQQVPVEYRVV
jgi:hypothetical protein